LSTINKSDAHSSMRLRRIRSIQTLQVSILGELGSECHPSNSRTDRRQIWSVMRTHYAVFRFSLYRSTLYAFECSKIYLLSHSSTGDCRKECASNGFCQAVSVSRISEEKYLCNVSESFQDSSDLIQNMNMTTFVKGLRIIIINVLLYCKII